jgi:flagellar biosynthesis chaperone FliJ
VLKRREEAQKLRIAEQRRQVAWASDKLELRKKELNEAMAHVRALEKLKEKRRHEHELAVQKAEESRRDDDAIQLWNNRPNR